MEIPNGFYRTSIKALIFDKDKRFLLCLEDNGLWEIPGGSLDFGENPEDCLKRELMEEMGVKVIKIGKKPLYFLNFLNNKNYWTTNIVFEVEVENLEIVKSDECVEARFFSKTEAEKVNLNNSVKKLLEMYE